MNVVNAYLGYSLARAVSRRALAVLWDDAGQQDGTERIDGEGKFEGLERIRARDRVHLGRIIHVVANLSSWRKTATNPGCEYLVSRANAHPRLKFTPHQAIASGVFTA